MENKASVKDKISQLFKFLKNWFCDLSNWKRYLLTTFLSSLLGASFISFFNKYALYYHSYRQSFRMPLEGVEYVNLAITTVSFFIILISFIGVILIYFALSFIGKKIKKYVVDVSDSAQKNIASGLFFIAIIYMMIFCLYVLYSIVSNQYMNILKVDFWHFFYLYLTFIFSFALVLIFLAFIADTCRRLLLAFITSLSGVCIIVILLFYQPLYKHFLKTIKYGGGVSIEVEYRVTDDNQLTVRGRLLIRSNLYVMLKNEETKNVEEIPISRISKITFNNFTERVN